MADGETGWFSEDSATFGDRVAGAREHCGLSQEDLAHRLGVKLTTLQNWEDDLREPRANKLQMLAGVLGVSMRWLLIGEGDGIDGPSETPNEDDAAAALLELRQLRTELLRMGERMAVLEKRLRAALT